MCNDKLLHELSCVLIHWIKGQKNSFYTATSKIWVFLGSGDVFVFLINTYFPTSAPSRFTPVRLDLKRRSYPSTWPCWRIILWASSLMMRPWNQIWVLWITGRKTSFTRSLNISKCTSKGKTSKHFPTGPTPHTQPPTSGVSLQWEQSRRAFDPKKDCRVKVVVGTKCKEIHFKAFLMCEMVTVTFDLSQYNLFILESWC